MMARKDFSFEIKAVDEAGVVEGYGSTFGGAPDAYGDVIEPGAYAQTLVRHRREGTMPLMFFGHKHNDLTIGKWTDMAEDGKGLWVKGEIDMDDPESARIHRKLKRKEMRGLSIGYDIPAGGAEMDKKRPGVRILKEIELFEVSIVNIAANNRANVEAVKAFETRQLRDRLAAGDRLTVREMERLLKSDEPLSLSNAEAERAVRLNFKGQGAPGDTANPVDFAAKLRAALG